LQTGHHGAWKKTRVVFPSAAAALKAALEKGLSSFGESSRDIEWSIFVIGLADAALPVID